MKKNLLIIALFLIIGFPVVKMTGDFLNKPAWADQSSLVQQKPKTTDLDVFYSSVNAAYGVNWSDLVRYQMQAVNWVAIGFVQPTGGTGGGVNWTMPNAYVGA